MKMDDRRSVIKEIGPFMKTPIVSISGESGVGKTTLAQQLVGSLIGQTEKTCIWIQASERFSKTRFKTLFPKCYPKLLEEFFIAPSYGIFQSFGEQSEFFKRLHQGEMMLPPNAKYLVIDNISHHLRYEVLREKNIESISETLNRFFEELLSPLLFFCQIRSIFLILIHEITYNPKKDQNEKFYNKLYSRLKSTEIILEKEGNSDKKRLILQVKECRMRFQYEISPQGIVIKNSSSHLP
ncbi:MAG: putative DNA repair and recombination protein RadB [Promethearchaeota archaeon]|nr:MAG: putative DNA repair and recombination protein RadB [Candidatus Lokiarchaeota archaeon]